MNRHETPAPRKALLLRKEPEQPAEPQNPTAAALAALVADYHQGKFGAGMLATQAFWLGRKERMMKERKEEEKP